MKEITIYVCEDGTRFDIKKDAVEYEELCERVNKAISPLGKKDYRYLTPYEQGVLQRIIRHIMEPLGERPVLEFGQDIFKQHDLNMVKLVFREIFCLCLNLKIIPECFKDETRLSRFIDYYIGKSELKILRFASLRLMNISERTGREYQSYLLVKSED